MEKAQYRAYFSSFMDALTNSLRECMKIDVEAQTGILTNFWVWKTMVGSKMFYDAKIAELESPERAFSAFFMQLSVKWV